MNNYGAILDDFGFYPCLQELIETYVQPLSKLVYPYIPDLDSHHGFLVSYEIGKDTKLDFHVDMADVTLNVCLGKEFEGGDLYFGGRRCGRHQQTGPLPSEEFYFSHVYGTALLHVGKHRHLAKEIKSGERHNLILWCKSSEFSKSEDYGLNTCAPW
eukprot:CAMPEP_0174250244 /NCGR_PEP_ID=MMETSP0439-20130205/474_1 /TAXON_ID=0 /ORGANISM="Stereomyxa ramosa, Strain Chinc5" /LENGTH=156 /DNA_ID=CAMNT_0015330263 /DNA_START=558 /DNA_END=1025 /DNA_ORIENTATION=-